MFENLKVHNDGLGDYVYFRSLIRHTPKSCRRDVKAAADRDFMTYFYKGDRLRRVPWNNLNIKTINRILHPPKVSQAPKRTVILWDHRTVVFPLTEQFGDMSKDALTTLGSFVYSHIPSPVREFLGDQECQERSFTHVVCDDRSPYWRAPILADFMRGKLGDQFNESTHGYKAGRPPKTKTWEKVDAAFTESRLITQSPYLAFQGFEADDLIAEAVKQANEDTTIENVFIVTVDSDLLQLVGGKVYWVNVARWLPRLRGVPEALAYWEKRERVKVSRIMDIVDHKTRKGDKADNLPPDGLRGLIDLWNPLVELPDEAKTQVKHALVHPPAKGAGVSYNALLTKGIPFQGI